MENVLELFGMMNEKKGKNKVVFTQERQIIMKY